MLLGLNSVIQAEAGTTCNRTPHPKKNERGRCIYELSDREMVYVAYSAAVERVLDFIGERLVGNPQLTWTTGKALV